MIDDDATGYWALMFWHFHGLREGSGRYVGELLAARYGQANNAPAKFDDLLAQLEVAEAEASSPPLPEVVATPAAAHDAP